jgi:adenylate cyclase class 2
MSYEVEVKYRDVDHADLARRLQARGAKASPPQDQEDVYLSHPCRDFARTNEALRLRRIGPENRITYKGPRLEGPTKTRPEIEIPFEGGPEAFEQLARLFENLGFGRVASVRKRRESFHLTVRERPIEVVLDEAESLGTFAEVEAFANDDSEVPAARELVLAVAEELGLTMVEPRSYLRMVLEKQARA